MIRTAAIVAIISCIVLPRTARIQSRFQTKCSYRICARVAPQRSHPHDHRHPHPHPHPHPQAFRKCHLKKESIPLVVLDFVPEVMANPTMDPSKLQQVNAVIDSSGSHSTMEPREFTYAITDVSALVHVLDSCEVLHCRVITATPQFACTHDPLCRLTLTSTTTIY